MGEATGSGETNQPSVPPASNQPAAIDQLPPHDLEAEQALLGSLLIDRDAIIGIADQVEPEDFFHGANGTIYAAIRALYRARRPADFVILSNLLQDRGRLDLVGGVAYLSSLLSATPTSVHCGYYAEIVVRCAKRRALIDAGAELVSRGFRDDLDPEDAVSLIRNKTARYAPEPAGAGLTAAVMEEHRDQVLARWNGSLVEHVIPTGIEQLDRIMYGGLRPGESCYLGGRPGSGKTSLMLQIAIEAARRTGLVSLVAELEMSREALLNRAIAQVAGVPYGVAYERVGDIAQRNRWLEASERLSEIPVVIETTIRTTDQIANYAERLRIDQPLGLICIDHLDWLRDRVHGDSPESRIAELSRRCGELGKQLGVPVVVLSQLNRAVEAKPPFTPDLGHLKGSGAIEANADYAFLLYRRMYYVEKGMLEADPDRDWVTGSNLHRVDLRVSKSRNGLVTSIDLGWEAETMAFRQLVNGRAA